MNVRLEEDEFHALRQRITVFKQLILTGCRNVALGTGLAAIALDR